MKFRDYYHVLGVDRDASADTIRKAFRRLARKYHPDVSKEADADHRMKEINEAYAVLGDTEKRAEYDRLGQGWSAGHDFTPPPEWAGSFHAAGGEHARGDMGDFSEFFEHFFGRGAQRRGGPGGRPEVDGRGEDHRARVELDIADSFHGTTRQITLQTPSIDGRGQVGMTTRSLDVRIPVGVREGQVIRLAGQGHPGFGRGPAGDLLLEVRFRPHPALRVEGRDLRMRLPVAPWEAALGAEVRIELPSGPIRVRIPADTQGGRQLRVRGRGIPASPPGDLLLDVAIALPPASDPKARALYERMAGELDFDPRSTPPSG